MTIRTRLTLCNAGVLLLSLTLIAVLSLDELHEHHARRSPGSKKDVEEILAIVFWVGVPAAWLSIVGGWWLMRRALAPVENLARAAEQISEKTLGEPLPRTGNGDELDRLTEVLNAMNARLRDSFARVHEFTLHASHELKTPVTILCGETETALRDESLTPAQRERAASQLDELHRLSRIVDGLTLLTKADAGLVSLSFAPVRLDELVRDSFADAQILAQAQHLRVELKTCEETVVRGDAHRLRQLLLNLIDNSVKYNQPRGSVAIGLRQAEGAAEYTISNNGAGIPAETLPRVFDRFFRGDPAHGSAIEGCGLGLSIAKWIVAAHGGTIRIDSQPANSTTVTVRLPLSRNHSVGREAIAPQIFAQGEE
jgi:signal transduction histidine kinase